MNLAATSVLVTGALVVLVLLLLALVVLGFNRLRRADIAAQEALGGIDVQLTRRAELVPNLVETVKGYAGHEEAVLGEVTRARARLQQAASGADVGEKAAADAELQSALVRVAAVAEAYPDLRANENFLELQRQLATAEDRVSFARQYYNDAVRSLNTLVQTIPWMFITGLASVHRRDFYDAPRGHDEVPRVQF